MAEEDVDQDFTELQVRLQGRLTYVNESVRNIIVRSHLMCCVISYLCPMRGAALAV
jgi:hypothetical protein